MKDRALPKTEVEEYVRQLAEQSGITSERDSISKMAQAVTELAGDDIVISEVETLIANLHRAGIISKSEGITLIGRYLAEKRTGL